MKKFAWLFVLSVITSAQAEDADKPVRPSWDRIGWFLRMEDAAQIRTVVSLYEQKKLVPEGADQKFAIAMALHQFYSPALLDLVKVSPTGLDSDQRKKHLERLIKTKSGILESHTLLSKLSVGDLTRTRKSGDAIRSITRFQAALLAEANGRLAEVNARRFSQSEITREVATATTDSVSSGTIRTQLLDKVDTLVDDFDKESKAIGKLSESIAASYSMIQGMRRALKPMVENFTAFNQNKQAAEFSKLLDAIDTLLGETEFRKSEINWEQEKGYPPQLGGMEKAEVTKWAHDTQKKDFPALELYRHLLTQRIAQIKSAKGVADKELEAIRKANPDTVRKEFGKAFIDYLKANYGAAEALEIQSLLREYKSQLRPGVK